MKLEQAIAAIERACKWRAHFAGWQLGTRTKDDPQVQAVRDTAENLIMLRCENSALARVLVEAGLMTAEKYTIMIGEEAELLMKQFEERWPGARSIDNGMSYDLERAQTWMKGWPP